jgi:hypothetical protein
MAIEDIVDVTITTETARVSQAGFGVPLVAAYHTKWPERVRTYTSSSVLSTMVDEGFAVTDPAYLAVASMVSQSPRPKTVKIGRRSEGAWTQVVRITPTSAVNDAVYAVSVNGTTRSYTADGTATMAEICTGLATAISLDAGVTASGVSGTHVDCTSDTALTIHTYEYVVGQEQNFSILDQTAEQNIATDLNLIRAADGDWYGLAIDSPSTVEVMDAAAWAETQRVMFVPQTADTDAISSSTTDILSDLQDLSYARTVPVYHHVQDSFIGAGWLALMLTYQPGSATWNFKTVAGSAVSTLTATHITNLKAKSANFYTTVGGKNIMQDGVSSGGEFADITVGVDWLRARITERIFAMLANLAKLPYTDASVDMVKSEIHAQCKQGVDRGLLVAGSIVVDAPLVSEVSTNDRAARLLPDVTFSARLAGAIHKVEIRGNLSV